VLAIVFHFSSEELSISIQCRKDGEGSQCKLLRARDPEVCIGLKCLSYVLIVCLFALLGSLKNLFHQGLNPLSAVPST